MQVSLPACTISVVVSVPAAREEAPKRVLSSGRGFGDAWEAKEA